jgi:predicted DNA-binding transcriptional regulator YafY
MAQVKYIVRYLKIIQRIKKGDYPTKENILNYLIENDFDINPRTLNRDFNSIDELFEIEIKYSRQQKGYYILVEEDDFFSTKINETINLLSSLKLVGKNKNVIAFENRKANGLDNIYPLIDAIKSNRTIQFNYEKYQTKTKTERTVEPFFIKESQGRWYLIAKDLKDKHIKTFGLDRISSITKTPYYFDTLPHNNLLNLFDDYFGIINYGEPKEIALRVYGVNGLYIKSYPFHHSQNIIKETDEYIEFSLNIAITDDLIMEFLKYGASIKVLYPKSLINKLTSEYKKSLNLYNNE